PPSSLLPPHDPAVLSFPTGNLVTDAPNVSTPDPPGWSAASATGGLAAGGAPGQSPQPRCCVTGATEASTRTAAATGGGTRGRVSGGRSRKAPGRTPLGSETRAMTHIAAAARFGTIPRTALNVRPNGSAARPRVLYPHLGAVPGCWQLRSCTD
ncbi:hypothetical protein Vafri_12013, partial [Volvox africanus]